MNTAHHPRLLHRLDVMGTVVVIDLYNDAGVDKAVAGPYLERANAALITADKTFSTFMSTSPLRRLRDGQLAIEDAPSDILDVIALCKTAREISRGWFDPWALPGGFDPTGYVKGWAAQRALESLRGSAPGAMVNAAGDIVTFGGPSAGQPFRIGVTNPAASGTLAGVLEVAGAVATSGSYEQAGQLYNPHAHRYETRAASATVTGPDLGLSDALATALAVAGDILLGDIEELDGYEALLIDNQGNLSTTTHLVWTTSL